MKKTVAMLVTGGLLISCLAGCGGSDGTASSADNTASAASAVSEAADNSAAESSAADSTADSSAADSTAASAAGASGETIKIAFSPDGMNDESQAYAATQFEKYAEEYGFDVTILDGQSDAQVQSKAITSAISQGYDAIIVNPADVYGVANAVKEAHDNGIIVGMFSTDLPEEYQEYRDFWVGADHVESGRTAAAFLLEQFPDGCNVVEVGGQAGHNAAIGRHDGFTEAIEGTNINVLDSQYCQTWNTSDAMAIMEDDIVKYGDEINAVFCHWDNGLTGCIEAMQAANINIDDVYMIGIDGCRNGFAQVEAGTQDVTIMQNFITQVVKSFEVCRAAVEGGSYEKQNACPWDIVTADNISEFEVPEW